MAAVHLPRATANPASTDPARLPRTSPIRWETSPGLIAYPAAIARMEAEVAAIRDAGAGELVWLLEHPPLYTAGTSATPDELVAPMNLPVFATGRGGRYTYHGPGQRIAYVLLDLKRFGCDLRGHVHRLEELVIRTLADLGLRGERRPDRIGVWVVRDGREAKIAAIGVRVRRWVSYHGLAINIAPDLGHFGGIIPCGIREHGVTSLRALGFAAELSDIDAGLRKHFDAVFAR
jgi:lipoyl(octanoyl) transferase